ncbi:MAG TPA: translation initiation factor IF-3 [Gammaproteobacteria bacterium]|nr:translation initiation factor IF-3 [Gammaproteobacteria bacterium]
MGDSSISKNIRLNDKIRVREVRLIDNEGQQLGIVLIEEALRLAREAELDLVEIAPNEKPPVCRIMDYGKFLFEQRKKQHAAKKKQKQIQIKEIKLRPTTEEADYQVKLRSLRRFLEEGDKVKITIRFRGREVMHNDLGLALLKRLEQDILDLGVVEQHPRLEGRQMGMLIGSNKKVK